MFQTSHTSSNNILSVLIPTIPDRVDKFTKVYNELMRQVAFMQTVHPSLGDIEVLVDDSISYLSGGMSIGKKRDRLVSLATGKYLCFLDDDDWIAPNYLEILVRMCNAGDYDILTFLALAKLDNFWMIVQMSFWQPENEEAEPGIINRKPWHICPVLSEIAKRHPFPDRNYGEDWEWFKEVLKDCKKPIQTNCILYQYNHGKHSESDKIMKHAQSKQ
jgi:glycosyltransferase involved in cell wall biosynthesis